MIKKSIIASVLTYSSISNAWVPCAPICDLTCSGFALTIGSAEQVEKLLQLSLKAATLSMNASQLEDEYQAYSGEVSEAWEAAENGISGKLIESKILDLSYTDVILDKVRGASLAQEAAVKSKIGLQSELGLSLQNRISDTFAEVMRLYYQYLPHDQETNLSPYATIVPYQLGLTRSELTKRLHYDGLQMLAAKRFVLSQFGQGEQLLTASTLVREEIPPYIFGISGIDFKSEHDPYLGREGSIPFRNAVIRRNQLLQEAPVQAFSKMELLGQADLYGRLLIQQNIANTLSLDRFNSTFSQSISNYQ